ncbi:MAG: imidazoleglycerol-phosphate dehydratase [Candidatus Longimicrobiales bacterium M2_2A_002]
MSSLTRETGETAVTVTLADGRQGASAGSIVTDDEFLTHMLITLARYSGLPLSVEATGDLQHHLIEDVAITLGAVLGRDTPATCVRYGVATIPMDDALVQVALDAGGRPHFGGELPSDLYEHFFRSLALNAHWTVHVRVIRGRDRHHIVEAAFKALGMAMARALSDDGAVFSTKGSVAMEWTGHLDEAAELGDG